MPQATTIDISVDLSRITSQLARAFSCSLHPLVRNFQEVFQSTLRMEESMRNLSERLDMDFIQAVAQSGISASEAGRAMRDVMLNLERQGASSKEVIIIDIHAIRLLRFLRKRSPDCMIAVNTPRLLRFKRK